LERCTVAALAEAHKVIKRPKTKTDRIGYHFGELTLQQPFVSLRVQRITTDHAVVANRSSP